MSGHGGPELTALSSANRRAVKGRKLQRLAERKAYSSSLMPRAMPIGHYGPGGPEITGFRHFMGPPQPDQTFKIYGRDPHKCPENTEMLRTLMGRVALHMVDDIKWAPHAVRGAERADQSPEPSENPNLPSGYTYFLQLVAHDLVQTSLPLSILEDATTGVRNARGYSLRLATIYGDGPLACPSVYALDRTPYTIPPRLNLTRTKLRLGRMKDMGCPFRDIARSPAENVTKVDMGCAVTEPLIADPRNDDHPIIAQLTALFHHLNNGIIENLLPKELVMADSEWEAAFDRYLCARDAVTLIYRNVIKKDLLKRLLHPEIYKRYAVESPVFLDKESNYPDSLHELAGLRPERLKQDWRIPLEFSHAAFRFAHAMVRQSYRFNGYGKEPLTIRDALITNSTAEPGGMPLDQTWIVQWSRFFELNEQRPNLSMRIGPHLAEGLSLPDEIDPQKTKRLSYRDLLSSGFVGLWSVGALVQEIQKSTVGADLIKLSPILESPKQRAALVRKWIGDSKDFEPEDVETLADDPPLYLFALLEAAYDPECLEPQHGYKLGVLGSIIVAEVIFRALVLDPLPSEVDSCSLRESLSKLSRSIYDCDYLGCIPEIDTMAALVEFTAKIASPNLQSATPPFL